MIDKVFKTQNDCFYSEYNAAYVDSFSSALWRLKELIENKDRYLDEGKLIENETEIRSAVKEVQNALNKKLITTYILKK